MAAHVHVTEPAGLVEMRERSFQQLTASAGITLPRGSRVSSRSGRTHRSHVSMEGSSVWTSPSIEERQEMLIVLAKDVWRTEALPLVASS
jgi:hypothetical protein